MNSNLYDREAKLPESLLKHLKQCINSTNGNTNIEGYKRNQELTKSGLATYQQIKRIKNWFDSYNGNKEDAPFILNGGDRMNNWCDTVLNHWRESVKGGKQIKSDTGMQNAFIDDHSKEGGSINPGDRHKDGFSKHDASISESINRFKKIIEYGNTK
jgi:hypothetical protein